MRNRSLFLILICLLGCAHTNPGKFTKEISQQEIQILLKQKLAKGMLIPDAIKFMESEGFMCEVERESDFKYRDEENSSLEGITLKGIDYIRCHRKKQEGFWVTCSLTVALILTEDVVTDVRTDVTCTGP